MLDRYAELPIEVVELPATLEEIEAAVVDAEVLLDSCEASAGFKTELISPEMIDEHARDEALAEIRLGDLNTELDPDEEKDRIRRAVWWDVPPEMHGDYGSMTIEAGARLKIAPIPRFEALVRIFKKELLEPNGAEGGPGSGTDVAG